VKVEIILYAIPEVYHRAIYRQVEFVAKLYQFRFAVRAENFRVWGSALSRRHGGRKAGNESGDEGMT
jgi:hypothetical protein